MDTTDQTPTRRDALRALLAASLLLASGCGRGTDAAGEASPVLRLAFFPNVTHAVALVGTGSGAFAKSLGEAVTIEQRTFTAGPAQIEALFAGEVDIGYIGPGPALNGYLKSRGKALRIIAGAASGGVGLVVRADAGIADIGDLAGKRVAVPQTGGTQDISLRHALAEAGLLSTDRGGTVAVLQSAPADALTLFQRKELDAAWVPEPWVTRLMDEGGGRLLLDERDRWPGGRFATTVVIARTTFLEAHPDRVRRFLDAHVQTVRQIEGDPEGTRRIVGERIRQLTTKPLPDAVLRTALARTDFTYDPLQESLLTFADRARDLGYQRVGRSGLEGLLHLEPLNAALADQGQEPIR